MAKLVPSGVKQDEAHRYVLQPSRHWPITPRERVLAAR